MRITLVMGRYSCSWKKTYIAYAIAMAVLGAFLLQYMSLPLHAAQHSLASQQGSRDAGKTNDDQGPSECDLCIAFHAKQLRPDSISVPLIFRTLQFLELPPETGSFDHVR